MNRYQCTLTNGPTFDNSNLGSIKFDGINDYVNTVDTPLRMGNTFTVNVWYYWDGINTQAGIIGKRNGQLSFTQYGFTIIDSINIGGNSNKIHFVMIPTSGTQKSMFYPMPSAGWYNACATIAPTEQKLYINGVLVATNTDNYTNTNFNVPNRNLLIGATWNDAGTGVIIPFNNRVSYTSVYNITLTAADVSQNFNSLRGRYNL